MNISEILEYDRKFIWHPYDSVLNPLDVMPVDYAYDEFIVLKDGTILIDGMSSWWSVIHGYNNPFINNKIKAQIDKFAHVMFGGLTHEPAVELGIKLNKFLNNNFQKFFFCDSGSVSVEVAVKMAFQYHMGKGRKSRDKVLSFHGAYHGDTFMAMSLCDPVNSMHTEFNHILPKNIFAPRPKTPFGEQYRNDHLELLRIVEEHKDRISAIIIEPVVQGAGGMWFYNPQFLNELRTICDLNDIVLIFDEIATGFGRTGKMFAYEYSSIVPDIICLGKALTGGYISFGVVGCSENVANSVCSPIGPGAFMHGPTFMGNPLACACANGSLELLENGNALENVKKIESIISSIFENAKNFKFVKDVRVLGGIGVIEVSKNVDLRSITPKFVKNGVWVRPYKNLIYIMPPFIISEESLKKLCKVVLEVVWEEFSKI